MALLAGTALVAGHSTLHAAPVPPPPPPPAPYVADTAPPPTAPVAINGVKVYNPITIGKNNPGQNVVVNGAVTTLGGVTIGQNAGSDDNLLTIATAGLLTNGDFVTPVIVGDMGSGNTLAVNAGGSLTALEVILGNAVGADSNQFLIDTADPYSLVSVSTLTVGQSGSSNTLSVSNGGYLFSSLAMLGYDSGSSFNAAVVTGADSRWDIVATDPVLATGMWGDDNRAEVSDGGILALTGTAGGTITMGGLGGDRNDLFIGYGGYATHTGDIFVGENGSANTLDLYFSGVLETGGNAYVGGGPDYSASRFGVARDVADSNRVVVDGLATRWTIGKTLYIGAGQGPSSNGNQVSVQYGGALAAATGIYLGYDEFSNGNALSVSGVDAADIPNPSLLTTTDIRIGITGEDPDTPVSWGNSVMAGSEDPSIYSGTIQAERIFVGSGNTLVLGGGGLIETGALSFGGMSDYRVHVNSVSRGALNVSGTAALGGTVSMSFGESFDNRYVIMTSGATIGSFAGLDTSNLAPELTAALETSPDGTEVAITFTSQFAQTPGLDANQLDVATSLDTSFNSGSSIPGELATAPLPPPADPQPMMLMSVAPAFAPPGIDRARLRDRLSSLTGEAGASGGSMALKQAGQSFLSLLMARRDEMGPGQGKALWSSAYGVNATTQGDDATGSHDTDTGAMGLATGWEYRIAPDTTFGVAMAGGSANWSLDENLGSGESTFLQLGAYGEHLAGAAYLMAAGGIAWHGMSTDREVSLLTQHRYRSDYSGQDAALRVEGGYRLGTEKSPGLTPFAALEGHIVGIGAHDEEASSGRGAFALSCDETITQTLRSELGLTLDAGALLDGSRLSLDLSAAWAHEWTGGDDGAVEASFQSVENASFTVRGAEAPEDTLRVSGRLGAWLTDTLELSAHVEGEFGDGYESLAGGLSLDFPL